MVDTWWKISNQKYVEMEKNEMFRSRKNQNVKSFLEKTENMCIFDLSLFECLFLHDCKLSESSKLILTKVENYIKLLY